MKRLSIALLGAVVTGLAAAMTAINAGPAAAQAQGASLLQTKPVSVKQINVNPQPSQGDPYSTNNLNTLSTTLQARPRRQSEEKSPIPIPDNIVRPETNSSVNPLDLFSIPGLDRGVSVTVGSD